MYDINGGLARHIGAFYFYIIYPIDIIPAHIHSYICTIYTIFDKLYTISHKLHYNFAQDLFEK